MLKDHKEVVKKVLDNDHMIKDLCAGLVENGTPQRALDTIIYYSYMAGRGIKF